MQNSLLRRPRYCTYSFIQFKPVPAVLRQANPPPPKPQEFCLHQDCKNNLPSTTVLLPPQSFFTFIALDNRGKSSKENQPPAWASQARLAARQPEHTRTDTHVHTHPGVCPGTLLPRPVPAEPQELREGPRGPSAMDGSDRKLLHRLWLFALRFGVQKVVFSLLFPHWGAGSRERSLQTSEVEGAGGLSLPWSPSSCIILALTASMEVWGTHLPPPLARGSPWCNGRRPIMDQNVVDLQLPKVVQLLFLTALKSTSEHTEESEGRK